MSGHLQITYYQLSRIIKNPAVIHRSTPGPATIFIICYFLSCYILTVGLPSAEIFQTLANVSSDVDKKA